MKHFIAITLCIGSIFSLTDNVYSQKTKTKKPSEDLNPLSRKNNLSGVQEKLVAKEKNSSGIKEYLERARDPKLMKTASIDVKRVFLRLKKELNSAKKRRVGTGGRGKFFLSKRQKKQTVSILEKRFQEVKNDYYGLKKGETFPRVPMTLPLKIGRIGMIPIEEAGVTIIGVKDEKEFSENVLMEGEWQEKWFFNSHIFYKSFVLVNNIKRGKKIKRLTFTKPSTTRTISDGVFTIELSEMSVFEDIFEIIGYYRKDRKIYYLIEPFEKSRLERYLKNENNPMPKRNDIDGQKSNRKKGG